MIAQRNISLLSNRLFREGGRRIPESVLERDYCLSWFLAGLSRSPIRDLLIFKGGTAIKKCYFANYRFSEDLDFTLAEAASFETIRTQLETVYDEVRRSSGIIIRFSREDRKKHQNSYTFYLAYEGPLPGTHTKEVKVDITIDERLVVPVQDRKLLKGYDEYTDLPEKEKLRVYALDEILVEKVAALTDFARNEPRDLYDAWYLTAMEKMDLSLLVPEITSKLEFRGRAIDGMADAFMKKETRLKKLWQARLAHQMVALPHFEEVYRSVRRSFRAAGLLK
jgi:hypothetical protein